LITIANSWFSSSESSGCDPDKCIIRTPNIQFTALTSDSIKRILLSLELKFDIKESHIFKRILLAE